MISCSEDGVRSWRCVEMKRVRDAVLVPCSSSDAGVTD